MQAQGFLFYSGNVDLLLPSRKGAMGLEAIYPNLSKPTPEHNTHYVAPEIWILESRNRKNNVGETLKASPNSYSPLVLASGLVE
jgi:hypothetical protein